MTQGALAGLVFGKASAMSRPKCYWNNQKAYNQYDKWVRDLVGTRSAAAGACEWRPVDHYNMAWALFMQTW